MLRFVIVPVDKASNIFGIVCKKFYLNVIKNEFDISNDGNVIGNKVYKPMYHEAGDTYTFHEQKLLITFGIQLLDINQYIYIYFIGLQNNKKTHIIFCLLQGLQNVTTNSLQ